MFLAPYLGRETTIAEAARQLDVSVSRMAYQTKRLVEVGLIGVTRTRPRAGRAVDYYRSTADEFIIPLLDVNDGDLEQYFLDMEEPLRRELVRSHVAAVARVGLPVERIGFRIRRTEQGGYSMTAGTIDGQEVPRPKTHWAGWTALALTPDDATELVAELVALWEKWSEKHALEPGTRFQLLRIATGTIERPTA